MNRYYAEVNFTHMRRSYLVYAKSVDEVRAALLKKWNARSEGDIIICDLDDYIRAYKPPELLLHIVYVT